MSEELVSAVLERLSQDAELPEDAQMLVMAALMGDDDLAQALAQEIPPTPPRPVNDDPTEPVRAYLSAITVEGFRGVGPSRSLTLSPRPGLVVVAGRNGSGKSSFAEAAEVTLTRDSFRWRTRPAAVQKTWRNLHHVENTRTRVTLAVEGQGTTDVEATWADGAALPDASCTVQRRGQPRQPGLDSLGWAREIELYRPFLSYEEIASEVSASSRLHAALDSVLGMEGLETARTRINTLLKQYESTAKESRQLRKNLRTALSASDDQRAVQALSHLTPTVAELKALTALATGHDRDDPRAVVGRDLRTVQITPVATFADQVARVRRESTALQTLHTRETAAADRRLDLLKAAVSLHTEHGDGPCPVCGQGELTARWAEQAEREITEQSAALTAIRAAQARLDQAWRAIAVRPQIPETLHQAAELGMPGAQVTQRAWQDWLALTGDDLIERGADQLLATVTALTACQSAVQQDTQDRNDTWQPLALELSRWCTLETQARSEEADRKTLKKAHDWVRRCADELRRDRIRPLAEQARQIWSVLKQESNVDLGGIELTGTGNQRKTILTATVDGEQTQAMEVMSQGELNALALALFLPKATVPQSPFGFLVIDDPVQAMDPAKVDGLARVLGEVAEHRQVVVFTHDDRLPDAIRRLNIPGRVLHVTRDQRSVLTVSNGADPAQRCIEDAVAIIKDGAVPDDLQRRLIPALCREGLESRCKEKFFAQQIEQGHSRPEVEKIWAGTRRTGPKLALALFGTEDEKRMWGWLRQDTKRTLGYNICARAVHQDQDGDWMRAVRATERLLVDLSRHRSGGSRAR